MADDPETLNLAREMLDELQGIRADLDNYRIEMREMAVDLARRLDGVALLPNVVAVIALNRESRLRRSAKRER